mmetsp:Transcript_21209/g.42636  ORF Transcript_21209/g.42636 Transcript_21209/m.42636 type:complete len:977 (-) Transcript_21209:10-2940(-)
MPALTIFRTFTTRPFAGDDLQLICFVLGTYRLIQLFCLIPLAVITLVNRFKGNDLLYNGYGRWCPQYELLSDNEFISLSYEDRQKVTRPSSQYLFTMLAAIFMVVDVAWMFAVWSAASVGTPTQPKGRDKILRPLIIFKMFVINFFPVALVVYGIIKTYNSRANNYGCGNVPLLYDPDATPAFVLFSILLVTYALELLVFPTIATNKIVKFTRGHIASERYSTQKRGERLEMCLGGLMKCFSVLLNNPNLGGKELKNKGELKDFASNLMGFANNDTKLDIVLSDMYIGAKMLARVQAERRLLAIQRLQQTSNQKKTEREDKDNIVEAPTGDAIEGATKKDYRSTLKKDGKRRSVLTLQTSEQGKEYVVVEKDVLCSDNKNDVDVLKEVAHYSIYAEYVYWHFRLVAIEHFALGKEETRFLPSSDTTWDLIREKFSLTSIGLDESLLVYASFHSGLASTPYAVIVDEVKETVVIAIRGTISMEDWVIDLQYVPSPLDKVGDICGFDGKGRLCHKGVLTRAKWLYNDLKKYRILKQLYAEDSPYKEHNLVVVGHSLGGGCAQVLSLLLRPSFPGLKCYAYEPPGCIFDDEFCSKSKEWITSIVRGDDVVPRLTQPNLETLRDEFFDVTAQIKVPKIKAFYDVRNPCPDSHLVSRNANMLCKKAQIDRDTSFAEKLRVLRNERADKNRESTKLYIAGKIIHLVDTTGDETKYVPYWASRYEFNQVVLSNKMLSDHSVPPLVQILKNLKLDETHEVLVQEHVIVNDEEDEEEVRVFICFSNPHGKISFIVLVFCFAAWITNIWSNQGCKFVSRTTIITSPNGTISPGPGMSAGMWAYNLRECIDPNSCDFDNFNDLQESEFCQPYPLGLIEIDANTKAARAFSSLANFIGFIGLGLVLFSTSMKLRKQSCVALFVVLFISCLVGGLQFLFLQGIMCGRIELVDGDSDATCTLSENGYAAVAAVVLWFVALVGSGVMLYTY